METRNVKRDAIAACMTCLLCHKIQVDATTITVCFHTFCRKCIYKQLSDEGKTCCPICNVYLGHDPIDKLRNDHNLQELRAKIFPFKRIKTIATKVVASVVESSITEPSFAEPSAEESTKIKERTLNSLYLEVKRRKAKAKKNNSTLLRFHTKQIQEENSLNAKQSDNTQNKAMEKLDHSNNFVAKTGNPTKNKAKTNKDKTESTMSLYELKVRSKQKKRKCDTSSMQASSDTFNVTHEICSPIWLSLVHLSDRKKEGGSLQATPWYLRIKNGNLPISFVQKYIVKKHNLASESEVCITCQGKSVDPSSSLRSLMEFYRHRIPPPLIRENLGTSAKDFVMVLHYTIKSSSLKQ